MTDKLELRRLAEAATPGPWKACGSARGGCGCGMVWSHRADVPVAEAWRGDREAPEPSEGAKANAAFIAGANPAALLALLDELEACKADADRYRWLCDGNGYFMEENMLCGHSNEKDAADKEIDAARAVDGKDG